MRALRVAIVAPSLGILGGQAVQADRLLKAWRTDPDVDAWLVPVNPIPPPPFHLATRVKYARTIVTEATYLPLLAREIARADLVHVFSASYSSFLLAPLPAVTVARLLGRPVILNYRSGQAPDHLRRSRVARRTLARVDRVVVPSRFLAEVFAGHGVSSTVIPNTVDLERFAFRERQPVRPRLLSTRNLEPLYDVGCTLRAFRLVQTRYPEASLTVVGDGPDEASLRTLASELRLQRVTFTGRMSPESIHEQYAAHDIYVQSPTIDNMPTSVLEAFASGLPVVSTRAGGVPAILTDGVHGRLVPIGDAAGLADAVISLLDRPDLASRLARQARATCDAFAWTSVRHQWLRLYRDVLPAWVSHPIETSWS